MNDKNLIVTAIDASSQITIVLMTSILTLIILLIRDRYANYKEKEKIIRGSKLQLESFSKALLASIMNNKNNLAKEHYINLLKNIGTISHNKELKDYYLILENIYIELQINDNLHLKEKKIAEIEEVISNLNVGV